MESVRKLPTGKLDQSDPNGGPAASGSIDLEGKEYNVTAADTADRKAWQTFLDDLLKKYAPTGKREVTTKSVQGENVEPLPLSFKELLSDPKKYDGKRIRITGFYHGEFEGSNFAATKKDLNDYDHALWLGEPSEFIDPKKATPPNDSTLTVDGTFEIGPSGHMGLWMGELSRLTAIEAAPAER